MTWTSFIPARHMSCAPWQWLAALAFMPLAATNTGTTPAMETRGPDVVARPTWKINTHLFAANLALADALDNGRVTIAPFGEFPVAPAALAALRAHPAAYRAGVLAPDLFPDMYVGGWFIHSDLSQTERWTADDWMRHVWRRVRAWPDAGERNKVMAFAYGFLTHGAGDAFAHTWVNERADGAWVSFWGKDRSTAFKHIVLEGYVGEHTPATDLSIDAWPRFVAEVLIKDPAVRPHTQGAFHYRRFLAIYDALPPLIEKAKEEMNGNGAKGKPYWARCMANPGPCARKERLESWRLDIGRGLRAMVDSSESLGEMLMAGETGSGIHAMTGWATEWLPKMYGLHAVGEGTAAMNELLAWADRAIPIDEAIKAEVDRFMKQQLPRVWEIYEAAKHPATYMEQPGFFPPGTKAKVNEEMGVAPGRSTLTWRAFEPLYNSVVLSKLALLDANGLNELARRAGLSTPLVPSADGVNIMLGVFRSMTQSHQWTGEVVKAETRFGICGPETGDPLPLEALCGQSSRLTTSGSRAQAPRSAGVPVRRGMTSAGAGISGPTGTAGGGGFVLWSNPEAREKIFKVVFKGFGPGPGPESPVATELGGSIGGMPPGRRELRVVVDLTERMREIVSVMEEKVGGAAPTQAGAPRLPSVPARGRELEPAVVAPADTGSWGERCCAKEIAEMRVAVRQLVAVSGRLRNPTVLGRLGRRSGAAQIGPRAVQLNAALDAFAATRDAPGAAAALNTVTRHVELLAGLAAGTQ